MRTAHLRRLLLLVGSLTGLCVLAQARVAGQEPVLPAAQDIIARHVAAVGGAEAHKAISSMHATGTCEIPAQGLSGTIDLYQARPAKALLRVDVPGVGKIEQGYDGKVAWEISPMGGPSLITGRRLTEVADDAWFDSFLHAPEHVKSMTTVAKSTFDQHPAWEVKVVSATGTESVEYYDVDSGLLIGSEATRETQMGVLPMVTVLRDYKKFGTMLEATTMSQRTMGIEQVVHLNTFEYDKVPASTFDLPPQIKALIGK